MDVYSEPHLKLCSHNDDPDCLVDLVDATNSVKGGVDDNLNLANALDEHVLIELGDRGVELYMPEMSSNVHR